VATDIRNRARTESFAIEARNDIPLAYVSRLRRGASTERQPVGVREQKDTSSFSGGLKDRHQLVEVGRRVSHAVTQKHKK
jgi:hypothetical protein